MPFKINDTSHYHINGLETLGWEVTVCNMLEPENSPCRDVLKTRSSFGSNLIGFLERYIPFNKIGSFIEIGGGYGYISRDLLRLYPHLKATLLDISPYLIERQKETLGKDSASFINMDFFETAGDFLSGFDAAILNENLGDFPCACGLDREMFNGGKTVPDECGALLDETKRLIDRYGLQIPDGDAFNFNTGAVLAVEKLCRSGIKYIYLSEHSCESEAPGWIADRVKIRASGNPEKISLNGHDEYTVKFSHLVNVAEKFSYGIKRGLFSDFIEFIYDGRMNFILTSNSQKDEHETIRQFIEDIFKYEYLILCRP